MEPRCSRLLRIVGPKQAKSVETVSSLPIADGAVYVKP